MVFKLGSSFERKKDKNKEYHYVYIIRDKYNNITSTTRMTQSWFSSLIEEDCEIFTYTVPLPKYNFYFKHPNKFEFLLDLINTVAYTIVHPNKRI